MPTQFFTGGPDTFTVTAAGDYFLTFLAGDDTLTVNGGTSVNAAMGEGDDLVRLQSGFSIVYGESGSDRFDIWAGSSFADGGSDNDLFNLRGGFATTAAGRDGNDRFNIYANVVSAFLDGGAGNDDFFGYDHVIDGEVRGDGGDDYFVGFSNAANTITLYGGGGNDIYRRYAGSGTGFIENPGEGIDSVQVQRGTTYVLPDNFERISVSGFSGSSLLPGAQLLGNALNNTITAHNNEESLYGFDGNDRLFGKGETDVLDGGLGNDYLDGGSGSDSLIGREGNDTLQGRTGSDGMSGGVGDDVYYVEDAGDAVTENVGEGTDTVRLSTVWYTLPANVENGIVSGSVGLALTGNTVANSLTGGSGDDGLYGLANDDVLRGGIGDDFLDGGDGDDLLFGGVGNDFLLGGAGADTLAGEGGTNSYNYLLLADSLPGSTDSITDFDSLAGVGGDVLDLSQIDADSIAAGNQAFVLNFTGLPAGAAGDMWLVSSSDGGAGYNFVIYGDVNGDSVADLEIHMHTSGLLSLDDIVF